MIKYFLKGKKAKSLAYAQGFEGRISFGSRKNSIPFNRDLFIFEVLLNACNHWDEKRGGGHGFCSVGINNPVTGVDLVMTEIGAIVPALTELANAIAGPGHNTYGACSYYVFLGD
jgi:hypothetical protein